MEVSSYNLNRIGLHIHFVLDKVTYPGWEDVRNLVNVHSFYWIHEGEGTFLTNTEHKVKPGMLAYLKPGLEMSMRSEAHAPLRMTMVLFDCAELSYNAVWEDITPIQKLTLPFLSQYSSFQIEEINSLFKDILLDWYPGLAGGAAVSQAKLQILLHKLHHIEPPDWIVKESGAFAAFELIKKHLEDGYMDNIRIDRLTEEYSISASYLRKLFLKYTGMGPKEYLLRLRNEHACRYLTFTDFPIKEIATLCGYYEEYHFSKMFKQLNGISPSGYRKQKRSVR